MPHVLSADAVDQYHRDGFLFPIRVMSAEDAAGYRAELEACEAGSGGPIGSNMRHKVHLFFTSAGEIIRHPAILDVVEDVFGPDLMCCSTSFFIKEHESPGFVTFHQGSTYWALDSPDACFSSMARCRTCHRIGELALPSAISQPMSAS